MREAGESPPEGPGAADLAEGIRDVLELDLEARRAINHKPR